MSASSGELSGRPDPPGPATLTHTTPVPRRNRQPHRGSRSATIPAMASGVVDRIRITTVVDNYIDNLRQDSAVARRYSAFVAGKMPDLRAEHGLAHFVETTRAGERFTMALDFGLTAETLNHNFRELALDPASIDAIGPSHGHPDHWRELASFLSASP